MNIFAGFQDHLADILRALIADGRLPQGLDLSRFAVEPPREASHGDLATNAAMVYAKEAKAHFATPRLFAEAIAANLHAIAGVESVEIAGPGFINIRLKADVFAGIMRHALLNAATFGRGAAKSGKVNVEYVSANPTGPMHVGHGRGAVFGDALANLLDFAGYDVTREYYINDAGAQVDVLARSANAHYQAIHSSSEAIIPEGGYPGEYLKPVGQLIWDKVGDEWINSSEDVWLKPIRSRAIDAMMDMIREDLAALNIRHEVFFSEASLTVKHDGTDAVQDAIADLRAKGLVYEGRLPPPKGQLPDDWEDREQTLFRSTQFGDDIDRPLLKSDGGYTYFASDIAYHKNKFDRGFTTMIDVWGADHGGYVKRMAAAVQAISGGKAVLDVKLCQLVRLMRNGEPVKMSKRSGDFITLRDVVDEVGLDAVRFMMLFRKNDATLDFDLAKVIDQSKENAVFYVQYAHARAHSVLRKAVDAFPDLDVSVQNLVQADLGLLNDEGEMGLIRLLAQYPRLIEAAAAAHEPHRVAFYLHDLASCFHGHWNRGDSQPELRFINQDSRELTMSRLALVKLFTQVLRSGLGVLGVNAPEEMR